MFVGGEAACEDFYDNSGAMFDIAREVGGLVAFLEHRCVLVSGTGRWSGIFGVFK